MRTALTGFKDFISRGNVVELAVAVVIGTAFGAVVTAFVSGLLTPLVAALAGQADFGDLSFTINDSTFAYGAFINALISFLMIAAVVYFAVVLPMNKLQEMRKRGQDPETKECPECLSDIPAQARRCAFCTTELRAE
ncbi:MAG: large conductance mechanosensitive channel protein MscL [Solirubrobacterales bacterium]